MKIKEAVDIINSTTTVKANHCYSDIFVCSKWASLDKCFLMIHGHTKTWGGVTLVSSAIYDVIPEDLARVMDVVQRLLDTPVKERFPEKKYRLATMRYIEGPTTTKQYVSNVHVGYDHVNFYFGSKENAGEWADTDLHYLSQYFPKEAIEAMKEPVEDN